MAGVTLLIALAALLASSLASDESRFVDQQNIMNVHEHHELVSSSSQGSTNSVDNGCRGGPDVAIKENRKMKMVIEALLGRKQRNCVGIYQPCGALDWCCEGLTCTGIVEGECRNDAFCIEGHNDCSWTWKPCCYPFTCTDGKCF